MRIMVVTDQYQPMLGGVPAVTRALARGLAERGHDVTLLAPSPDGRRRADAGEDQRVSVHYQRSLPWPWYDGMRLAFVSGPAARRLMAASSPDVAHIHSPLTLGVVARHAARRLGIPVVYTNHYLPENARARRRSRAFDTAFYSYLVRFSNRCAHVTAPTSTALGLLRDQGLRAPSGVISNGIDLDAFSPGPADDRVRERYGLPPGHPVILSVGRLSPEKNVHVLLDAAARLTHDAQVILVGTGPEESRLRTRAKRLGLTGRARFLGQVPDSDLPGLYRLADVFAIASQAELQSLATMEAMATGLPVVAANAYALGELVRHGSNGFLVPPGRPEDMLAGLDAMLADPGRRAAMGRESLRIIADHERERSLAQWEALYGQLAASARGASRP